MDTAKSNHDCEPTPPTVPTLWSLLEIIAYFSTMTAIFLWNGNYIVGSIILLLGIIAVNAIAKKLHEKRNNPGRFWANHKAEYDAYKEEVERRKKIEADGGWIEY